MNYVDSVVVKNGSVISNLEMVQSDDVVAYRVPEDAENALLLVESEEADVTIRAADHVFGGGEKRFQCGESPFAVYLDLNTCVQRSGEYKGCVLVEGLIEPFKSCLLILEK